MAFGILDAIAKSNQKWFETSTQAVVFHCFASYCDTSGRAWPSYATLAGQCNCSYRTVQRAFRYFKRRGYLIWARRWNNSSVCQITGWFLAQLRSLALKKNTAASWLRAKLGITAKSVDAKSRPNTTSDPKSSPPASSSLPVAAAAASPPNPPTPASSPQQPAARPKPSRIPPEIQAEIERIKADQAARERQRSLYRA